MQTATAIETRVDNDAVTEIVLAKDLGIHIAVAGVAHTADVDVAQTPVGQLLNRLLIMLHPTVVEQFIHRAMTDGFHRLIPSLTTIGNSYQNSLVSFVVQQRIVIHTFGNFHTVNLLYNRTCFHLGIFLVKGTAFHNLNNLQSVAFIIKVEKHTKLGCSIAFARGTIARTRMRHIELAQNLAQHFRKIVVVVDMCQERLIGFLHQSQVHAMMVFHEETFLGLQEHVVEHILTLSSKIKLHGSIKFN